jgi:Ca2+-binding RTX toxin-like protein
MLIYHILLILIGLQLNKENIKNTDNNSCSMQPGHPNRGAISFIMISLLFAGLVLVPIPTVLAQSNEEDFDHEDDVGDFDRSVETIASSTEEIFSDLPTHPEKDTITGNNDGAEIKGTRHDDIIIGTADNNRILGRDGADVINGAGGSDTVEGNDDDDTIQGAQGDEQMYGKRGNDVLSGGPDHDYLSGGSGMDQMFGDDGDDTLRGGDGADYFDCGVGFDVVYGYDRSQGDAHTPDCEVVLEKK